MSSKKQGKLGTIVLALLALIVVVAVFVVNHALLSPGAQEGIKEIQVTIVSPEGGIRNVEIVTDAEFLSDALLEHNLIAGDEGVFGLLVTTVDGHHANMGNQEWWHFARNGVPLEVGVDQTPIHDGDQIEISFMVGF